MQQGILKRPETSVDKAIQKNFVLNGMRILHGPETRDQVLERLGQGEPTDAVAAVSVMALEKMERSAQDQGKPLDDMVKFMGGNELVGEVIATGEAAGIFKLDDESRALAFSKVISQVLDRDIQGGKINPQELMQAGKQAQEQRGMNLNDGAQKLGIKKLNLSGV